MILLACVLLHACTNQNEIPTEQTMLDDDAIENTENIETPKDSSMSEVTSEVPVKNHTNSTPKKNTRKDKNRLLSAAELEALKNMFDFNNGEEIEGFASDDEDTTKVIIKYGAFDEMISATKSGTDMTDEMHFNSANDIDKSSIEYIRRPKPIVDYTGYKVELITVYNKSLELDDQLFKAFGHLMFKHNTTNSTTYYLGEFQDKDELEDYLKKVVKSRFPKAKGVKFKNGLQVKYN